MRTNIVINDDLLQKAKDISGLNTKKEIIDRALKEFIENHSRKNLMELKGQIKFKEEYDYKALREGKDHDIG